MVRFFPLTLICPPGNRMFSRKYSFLSVGLHLAIMATFLSRSRDLFSLLLTDVVIGLLLNVTHYMPFILPDLPHRTDYSLSEGNKKKLHFTMKNFFPKRLSRNQSTNYLCQYVGWGSADHPNPRLMYETNEKVYNGFSLPFPFL